MKILLHICCGPCAIMPVKALRQEGFEVTGFFMNPNIHPLGEYLKRREALVECAKKLALPLLFADEAWNIAKWLADRAGKRDQGEARCASCYADRLAATAGLAAKNGFDAFTTSLLYSRMQRHETIAEQGLKAAEELNSDHDVQLPSPDAPTATTADAQNTPPAACTAHISFLYRDFRSLWQQGIDESKAMGIYRQNYCGCIYSEAERHEKKLRRLRAAL